ncbi:MAG: hypothetical protein KDL10_05200, partial [Kiritimatiellae bacterium]|nr:hypothetical protein [Kiritimatiellia bacterium]
MIRTVSLSVAITGLYLSTIIPAGAVLTFTPLGDLPGGGTNSAAYGVSADGMVVVGSSASAAGVSPFKWTDGGGLIALPILPGGTSATAYAVSSDGQVMVGGSDSTAGPQACVWSNGMAIGLGDLAGGAFASVAYDVSEQGSVIVGYGTSASGREAFRWTGGAMSGLGDLAGGNFQSEAKAVTPDGSLITGYGTVSGQNIITWDAVNNLQDYYSSAVAYDVSSDGNQLVGHINSTFVIPEIVTINYRRAARWNGGSVTVLGPESTGQSFDSLFYGVTPDGSIAVGSFKGSSSGPYYAVSHDTYNGVRNLLDVLTAAGIDMTGWTLNAATGISADGSVIVGYGINPNGQQEAWVIRGYGLNLTLRWIGNTYHWPGNEALTAADDLWMNVDSKDPSVGVTGVVVYSTDKGMTWTNAPLTEGTPGP